MCLTNFFNRITPVLLSLHSVAMSILQVPNPGPEEPQGVLAFVATEQLIDQLKQLITRLSHLTWFLGLNWLLILGSKQKPAHPWTSVGHP